MAKVICNICGMVVLVYRSKHLRDEHGIDTSRGGAVSENFKSPEYYGLTSRDMNLYDVGDFVDLRLRGKQ